MSPLTLLLLIPCSLAAGWIARGPADKHPARCLYSPTLGSHQRDRRNPGFCVWCGGPMP